MIQVPVMYLAAGAVMVMLLTAAEVWRTSRRGRQAKHFTAWEVTVIVLLWPLLFFGVEALLGRWPEDGED